MSSKYKIHPAIGIARVGDSQEYYIAPDKAGALPTEYSVKPPVGTFFRDANDKLLRQAARFKIYEYSAANPAGVLVVPGQNGVKSIKWTTWIASKKASWFEFMQQTGHITIRSLPTGFEKSPEKSEQKRHCYAS